MFYKNNQIDWKKILYQTTKFLQYLISINTSGKNESILAQYTAQMLNNHDIEAKVYETEKKRGSLLARLPGGQKRALILLSHLDTAPVSKDKWPFNPYSGKIKNNWIYGRGAIDCKGLLAVHVATIITIKLLNLKLERDLYLISTAGEEEGGKIGVARLLEECPDLKDAEYVLAEGGGFRVKDKNTNYQLCQIGEKGRLKLIVNSKTNNKLILKYAQKTVQTYNPDNKLALPQTVSKRLDTERIFKNNVLQKENIITFETMAALDLKDIYNTFTKYMKKKDSQADIKIKKWIPGKISSTNTELYQTLKKETIEKAKAIVIPYITPGYSDNRFFREVGIKVYGYQPLLADCKPSWIHGIGERISLDSLNFGIQLLFNIISSAFSESNFK
ncbi:M20/M25/M40 family metallo-hydrolase [Halocella sp. SP3-1]|uniref:M20/M25/M40 family metallo-hydrolase n=1 Tax=Halocella sp. SP3-1 TaxID=2382161 RepID=UPI000F753B2F|nr:M20/M25/M40 family metallo-hydrolase [Halocella sp. SP3-1]AZO95951.1 M20/M25/M40 family metallo-hydrolase [Halocella sp. SP3-1]